MTPRHSGKESPLHLINTPLQRGGAVPELRFNCFNFNSFPPNFAVLPPFVGWSPIRRTPVLRLTNSLSPTTLSTLVSAFNRSVESHPAKPLRGPGGPLPF